MHKAVTTFKPQVVIVDSATSFVMGDNQTEVTAMLMRVVDFLKTEQITGVFTSLTSSGSPQEQTEVAVSSLIDTWLLLRDIELDGERNHVMCVVKSRGMAHSNQIREFLITDHGVELRDVYSGTEGALTGSAWLAQEGREQAAQLTYRQESERRHLDLERKRMAMDARIAAIRAEFAAEETETLNITAQEQTRGTALAQERVDMRLSRKADK